MAVLRSPVKVRRPPRILCESDEESVEASAVIKPASSVHEDDSLYYSCDDKSLEVICIDLSSSDEDDFAPVKLTPAARSARPKIIAIDSDEEEAEEEAPFLAYSPPPKSARKPLAILQNERTTLPSSTLQRKVPQSPLREHDAAFWDEQGHTQWIEQHIPSSPNKSVASPSTPRKSPNKAHMTLDARQKKQFLASREQAALAFLDRFLRCMCMTASEAAIHTLAQPITIIWSKTLNTTAGRALYRKSSHIAEIELSSKVIDCQARLEATLAHELCHLLTWIVSADFAHPHGKAFKAHAAATETRMGIRVSVKHDYEIDYKYQWSCTDSACGKIFGRHSKSIDPSKVCCGACRGKLIQVKPKPRLNAANGGTPARSIDGLSKYKVFLRDNMDGVKASHPGLKYSDLVKIIAAQYQESKQTSETHKMPDMAALSLS